jgi:hypothetical protein
MPRKTWEARPRQRYHGVRGSLGREPLSSRDYVKANSSWPPWPGSANEQWPSLSRIVAIPQSWVFPQCLSARDREKART